MADDYPAFTDNTIFSSDYTSDPGAGWIASLNSPDNYYTPNGTNVASGPSFLSQARSFLQGLVSGVAPIANSVASIVRSTSSPQTLPVGQNGAYTTRNGTTYAPVAGTAPQPSGAAGVAATVSNAFASVRPYLPWLLIGVAVIVVMKLVKKL